MSHLHYLDFYLNEDKILDTYTFHEDETNIETNDINEMVSSKYSEKETISFKNEKSQNMKSVKFSSPIIANSNIPIDIASVSFEQIVDKCAKKLKNKKPKNCDIKSIKLSPICNLKQIHSNQFIRIEDADDSDLESVIHVPNVERTDKDQLKSKNSFKRFLENVDTLPPKKRFLKRWNFQHDENNAAICLESTREKIMNSFDFSPKLICEDDQKPESSCLFQFNDNLNKSTHGHGNKITNFFQTTQKNDLSSQNLIIRPKNVENIGDAEKSKFNYFELPSEIKKIESNSEIQNNHGYQVLVNKYSDLFRDFQHFSQVQIRSISPIFESNNSLIIKGPTGSGKSTILEFAIIKLMDELNSIGCENFKVLLIEPTKIDCAKKVSQLQKFANFGMNCCSLMDEENFDEQVKRYSLIIGTPEKIEVLTRNAITLESLAKKLMLISIEGIEIMEDEKRGHFLEGILCRFKFVDLIYRTGTRFLVSATSVGDLDLLARFFGTKTKIIRCGEDCRAIPIEKRVIGYDVSESYSEFKFDQILTNNLINVLNQYQNGQQVIIYVSTRKIAEKTAEFLRRGNYKKHVANTTEMIDTANKISTVKLKDCILTGVGYHHGGLKLKEKTIVEQAYKKNLISVLCCTTSISVSESLFSNIVIIKGTFRFVNSRFVQYTETEINQMIGRTGLQNRNNGANIKKAVAIIMTKKCYVKLYDSIISDKKPLKSRLRKNLCELINSEIVLDHLNSFDHVLNYVKLSYLYVCLQHYPETYNVPAQSNIEQAIKTWINNILTDLKLYKVIASEDSQFTTINKTPIGLIMNKFGISFQSIKRFSNLVVDQTINSLLILFSHCKELVDQANIRNEEKVELNELNKGEKLKFPIRNRGSDKITDLNQKINCLLQAHLGVLLNPETHQILIREAAHYVKIAKSLAQALVEYLYLKAGKSFSTFKSAILLSKSLRAGIWYDATKKLSIQIPKIGLAYSSKLDEAGYTNFEKLRNVRALDIESYCNRQSPFGDAFVTFISKVPKYEMKILQPSISSELFTAELIVSIELQNFQCKPEGDNWLIVGDEENNLLFAKKISTSMFDTDDHAIEFEYQVKKVKTGLLAFNLLHESFVGSDISFKFTPNYRTNIE